MTIYDKLSLVGKSALVTGAGSEVGIGFASALYLGELGARITIAATTARIEQRVAQLTAKGIDAVGFVGDLTDPEVAEELIRVARAAYGPVDVLVNNAGMTSKAVAGESESGSVHLLTPDAFRLSLSRNLESAFLVSRQVLPDMIRQGDGRIINIASVTGPVMAMRGEAAYAAAKAGLVGLTKSMALDYARNGITVNAVAPGWIASTSQTDGEREEGHLVPVGRSGTVAEIASAVAWLASPSAAYLTGQCLVIDGGNSIAEQRAR
ncbi:3-oxoacyl-[acyl-carrier-protein] reductase FabG [mine drainage metagenome]|uniref:3-oxoacyl-[acyl-carrier-protein] reductase FabG n=1 Tax=mine drainage metagenome TaxID=410659 RepID=A0A1J5Q916_9ZZZZ